MAAVLPAPDTKVLRELLEGALERLAETKGDSR
jgi:hypothetical protein